METLIEVLEIDQQEQLKQSLEGTPFKVGDFYDYSPSTLLKKGVFFSFLMRGKVGTSLFEKELSLATDLHNKLEQVVSEKNWETVLLYVDRRDKVKAFMHLKETEEIAPNKLFNLFLYVFHSMEGDLRDFDKEVIKEMKKLNPDSYDEVKRLRVYRGANVRGEVDGFSWTTNKDVAEYFATLYDGYGELLVGTVNGGDIIWMDVNNEYGENEVIVPLKAVNNYEMYSIEGVKDEYWTIDKENCVMQIDKRRRNGMSKVIKLNVLTQQQEIVHLKLSNVLNKARVSTALEIAMFKQIVNQD